MVQRSISEKEDHYKVACLVGEWLYRRGWKVAVDADCRIYDISIQEEIDLHRFDDYCEEEEYREPDVYAKKGGKKIIVEVETKSSINTTRTECQMKSFSKNGKLIVYVPERRKGSMRKNRKEWKFRGKVKGYMKIDSEIELVDEPL